VPLPAHLANGVRSGQCRFEFTHWMPVSLIVAKTEAAILTLIGAVVLDRQSSLPSQVDQVSV
jgi:hypothetical protein